jgi:phosphoribosylamine--glycine ligase
MSLIEGDFYGLLKSAADGNLKPELVRVSDQRAAMCVVMAAAGYPATPRLGDAIAGIAEAEQVAGVSVYHAGTRAVGDDVVTSGGRVLGVTAVGDSLAEAKAKAYDGCERIRFSGAQYRRDIGFRALT